MNKKKFYSKLSIVLSAVLIASTIVVGKKTAVKGASGIESKSINYGFSDNSGWGGRNRFIPMDYDGDGNQELLARNAGGEFLVYKTQNNVMTKLTTFKPNFDFSDAAGWNSGNRFYVMRFNGKDRLVARAGNGELSVWAPDGQNLVKQSTNQLNISDAGGWNTENRFFVLKSSDGNDTLIARGAYGSMFSLKANGSNHTISNVGETSTICSDANNWDKGYRFYTMDFNNDGNQDLVGKYVDGTFAVWNWDPANNKLVYSNISFPTGYSDGSGWNSETRFWVMRINGKDNLFARDYQGYVTRMVPDGQKFVSQPTTASNLSDASGWNSGTRLYVERSADGNDKLACRSTEGVFTVGSTSKGNLSWEDSLSNIDVYTTFADTINGNDEQKFMTLDIDGDSASEFLTRDSNGNFSVYKPQGDNMKRISWMPLGYSDNSGWGSANRWFVMDINGDGKDDLVGRAADGSLIFFKSDGQKLARITSSPSGFLDDGYWYTNNRLFVLDINGDKKDDLIGRYANGDIAVYLSDGQYLQKSTTFPTVFTDAAGWDNGHRFDVMDINKDGKDDLLARSADGKINAFVSDGQKLVYYSVTPTNLTDANGYASSSSSMVMDTDGDGINEFVSRDRQGAFQTWSTNGTTLSLTKTIPTSLSDIAGWNSKNRFFVMDNKIGADYLLARGASGGFYAEKFGSNGLIDVCSTVPNNYIYNGSENINAAALGVHWPEASIQSSYQISLVDLTSNTTIASNQSTGTKTSVGLPVDRMTNGHKYRVDVLDAGNSSRIAQITFTYNFVPANIEECYNCSVPTGTTYFVNDYDKVYKENAGVRTSLNTYKGAYIFKSSMEADSDGAKSNYSDVGTHYFNTSYQPAGQSIDGNDSIDANEIPYLVLPTDYKTTFPGVKIGDFGIIYDTSTKRSVYAIFADAGPLDTDEYHRRIGEASLKAHMELGYDPRGGSIGQEESKFIYIVFPGTSLGSGDSVKITYDLVKQRASQCYQEWMNR